LLQKPGLLALALVVTALTACSETTPGPSASAALAKPPVDPTPITGNWCSSDGQRFSISGERFDSRDSQCSVTRMNNYEGTYTVAMSCTANGQQSNENITISPVGQSLHISFLSLGGKRAVVSRCAS